MNTVDKKSAGQYIQIHEVPALYYLDKLSNKALKLICEQELETSELEKFSVLYCFSLYLHCAKEPEADMDAIKKALESKLVSIKIKDPKLSALTKAFKSLVTDVIEDKHLDSFLSFILDFSLVDGYSVAAIKTIIETMFLELEKEVDVEKRGRIIEMIKEQVEVREIEPESVREIFIEFGRANELDLLYLNQLFEKALEDESEENIKNAMIRMENFYKSHGFNPEVWKLWESLPVRIRAWQCLPLQSEYEFLKDFLVEKFRDDLSEGNLQGAFSLVENGGIFKAMLFDEEIEDSGSFFVDPADLLSFFGIVDMYKEILLGKSEHGQELLKQVGSLFQRGVLVDFLPEFVIPALEQESIPIDERIKGAALYLDEVDEDNKEVLVQLVLLLYNSGRFFEAFNYWRYLKQIDVEIAFTEAIRKDSWGFIWQLIRDNKINEAVDIIDLLEPERWIWRGEEPEGGLLFAYLKYRHALLNNQYSGFYFNWVSTKFKLLVDLWCSDLSYRQAKDKSLPDLFNELESSFKKAEDNLKELLAELDEAKKQLYLKLQRFHKSVGKAIREGFKEGLTKDEIITKLKGIIGKIPGSPKSHKDQIEAIMKNLPKICKQEQEIENLEVAIREKKSIFKEQNGWLLIGGANINKQGLILELRKKQKAVSASGIVQGIYEEVISFLEGRKDFD